MKISHRRLATVFLSVFVALGFVHAFGTISYRFEAFLLDFSVRLKFPGHTRLILAPIGEVTGRTHKSPLDLVISLRNIDLKLLKKMTEDPPTRDQLIQAAEAESVKAVWRLVIRLVLLAAAGGCLGAYLGGRRRIWSLARGGLIGAGVLCLLLAFTYATYDAGAFKNPQYAGVVEAAPFVVNMIEEGVVKVGELGERLAVVSDNLFDLYNRIELLQPLAEPESDLRILHVSDIHNNPVAYDFVGQVADSFRADAIIDSGDITDWGTPLETDQLAKIADLGIPYIFVPGNHDSPEVLDALAALPNVTLLLAGETSIKGLTIGGLADPNSEAGTEIGVAPSAKLTASEDKLLRLVESSRPMVTVTHNKRIAKAVIGKAPLVLHGHDHQLRLSVEKGTVVVDAGTTGGEGIRGLENRHGIPYSLALLHFSLRNDAGRFAPTLVAVDTIKVLSLNTGFTMSRQVFLKPLEYPQNDERLNAGQTSGSS